MHLQAWGMAHTQLFDGSNVGRADGAVQQKRRDKKSEEVDIKIEIE